MTERTFDRKVRFDPASRSFPISAVVGSTTPFISKEWECNTWNDQGTEGACVGLGWGHELAATPEPVPTDVTVSRQIYRRAQQLDIWPGENYEGTSVLGGAKAVMELKNNVGEPYIKEYRWAFGLADVIRALAYQGPVVIGVNWYSGMFNVDSNGFINVAGFVAGGHCVLLLAVNIVRLQNGETGPLVSLSDVDLDNSYVVVHNSWGRDWGRNGRAKLTLRGLQRLLTEQGDACVPMVRTSDFVAPPVEPEVVEPVTPEPTPPAPEPEVPVDPEPVEPETNRYFVSTTRSKVYHDSHHRLPVLRTFATEEDAVAAGLRPCKTCKP